ncbi:triose-phosphate isomerase [Oscillatoria amoena NRMC-F 0135]|nr:triose-phosphate isomerase [Oscillatoria amoena NRMC-F 0135]
MRQKIVAGNWKMNKTHEEALQLASAVLEELNESFTTLSRVIFCPPFPYLIDLVNLTRNNTRFSVGAQNCSEHQWGAYTGEVSAPMLKSMGVKYVILGHSERRQYFGEEGALLAQKIDAALANNLLPIFCCGESLIVREDNRQNQLVTSQVEEALFHLPAEGIKKIVIAYEPVWAIGTGKTATTRQAQEMHAVIRTHLAGRYGQEAAEQISILYGGSVNAGNAKELFACADVDGGLVGGASLKAVEFAEIVRSIRQ